jgi:hypothetical protein
VSATLVWNGLAEHIDELRRLPRELAAEAGQLVDDSATAAAVAIRFGYGQHRWTGNLQDHVIVTRLGIGIYGAGAVVKSTAKHAWIFEHGTELRHTDLGSPRGRMPAGNIFIPAIIRERALLETQLAGLLERHGLRVSRA